MNKSEFLSSPDVAGFIEWLSEDFPKRSFHLKILRSRFVPAGLNVKETGIQNILKHYCWNTYWIDTRNNKKITSSNWQTTKESLEKLSNWLNCSVNSSDQTQTYQATLEVLRWGGVSGASRLMRHLYERGELVSYLKTTRKLLSIDGESSQKISDINADNIIKFDSGLTKIHSLHENGGSPIYDTRVAAAISLLYCLYRESCSSSIKRALEFPCGSARGDQLRNPGDLGFKRSAKFYTEIDDYEWAQVQLRLGWILSDLLAKNANLFQGEGTLAQRVHALEAALFLVGYDLRCFGEYRTKKIIKKNRNLSEGRENYGLVPTVHPFERIIKEFLLLKGKYINLDKHAFLKSMFSNYKLKESTKKSYLFPLGPLEFDLFAEDSCGIELLKKNSLSWLNVNFDNQGFSLPDERKHVCLQNAWLVGYLNRHYSKDRHQRLLEEAGFAGSGAADKNGKMRHLPANAIIYVGKNVGKFFGLLDDKNMPTDDFYRFFCNDMSEIESMLPDKEV